MHVLDDFFCGFGHYYDGCLYFAIVWLFNIEHGGISNVLKNLKPNHRNRILSRSIYKRIFDFYVMLVISNRRWINLGQNFWSFCSVRYHFSSDTFMESSETSIFDLFHTFYSSVFWKAYYIAFRITESSDFT